MPDENNSLASTDQRTLLLLKTRSAPTDSYEEHFQSSAGFRPRFIKVLEHRFIDSNLDWLQKLISDGAFALENRSTVAPTGERFGALIFTSQRAVDAFSQVLDRLEGQSLQRLLPDTLPIYVVGPATANAVRALNLACPVIGEDTGNGDALANFILATYSDYSQPQAMNRPVLFLVGEVRRDIIPRKLQSEDLEADRRIRVIERTVYESCERQVFAEELASILSEQSKHVGLLWIVVFSPTGCAALLSTLGWLDEHGRYCAGLANGRHDHVRIATIGPTTRDFLMDNFGFQPHACANQPSPSGVDRAMREYHE